VPFRLAPYTLKNISDTQEAPLARSGSTQTSYIDFIVFPLLAEKQDTLDSDLLSSSLDALETYLLNSME
jgi:hypothetical protein